MSGVKTPPLLWLISAIFALDGVNGFTRFITALISFQCEINDSANQ